jgi:hypothetical protein
MTRSLLVSAFEFGVTLVLQMRQALFAPAQALQGMTIAMLFAPEQRSWRSDD